MVSLLQLPDDGDSDGVVGVVGTAPERLSALSTEKLRAEVERLRARVAAREAGAGVILDDVDEAYPSRSSSPLDAGRRARARAAPVGVDMAPGGAGARTQP